MSEDINIYEQLLPFKDDPEAFERESKRILELEFSKLPEERKQEAYKFQWVLEGKLRKFKNPQARFNEFVEIFWKQFYEFNNALKSLNISLKNNEKE